MHTPSKILLGILLWILCALPATAKEVQKSRWTLWTNPDILLWSPEGKVPVDVYEFCMAIRRYNSGIGDPKCRALGEWERDTVANRYANWLKNNMEPGIKQEILRARHPAMMAKLQSLEDKIVLYLAEDGKQLKVAIFDETASEPKAIGILPNKTDRVALSDDIADEFFSGKTQRRLTKQERAKKLTEPDEYYQDVPDFKAWGGFSVGYARAKVPLTPDDWYDSHIKSKVRNYRITKDSLSLWNFLDDSGPMFNIYAGGLWYGFIGAEIFYRYANHRVKTDPKDPVYEELDHWEFSQHEIGMDAILSKNYGIKKWLDINLFAIIGFQYSFFVEDIELKKDVETPSKAYQARIKFEDAYKGALLGGGAQFIFMKHYAIDFRAGFSSRGRNIYSDPTPDAAAEPTTIGGSTIDCFISAGFEYHWTP